MTWTLLAEPIAINRDEVCAARVGREPYEMANQVVQREKSVCLQRVEPEVRICARAMML